MAAPLVKKDDGYGIMEGIASKLTNVLGAGCGNAASLNLAGVRLEIITRVSPPIPPWYYRGVLCHLISPIWRIKKKAVWDEKKIFKWVNMVRLVGQKEIPIDRGHEFLWHTRNFRCSLDFMKTWSWIIPS